MWKNQQRPHGGSTHPNRRRRAKTYNVKSVPVPPSFKTVAGTAVFFARRILDSCLVHDTPGNELDLQQAVAGFESAGLDFNDALLADICKKHDFKLLTNGGDFRFGGIEVLTTNPRLLNV
jgi:predicted nucleic acid-binding protein